MIWFALAVAITFFVIVVVSAEDDAAEGFFAGLMAAVVTAGFAFILNLCLMSVTDPHMSPGPVRPIKGPVFLTIDRDNGLYTTNIDSTDGVRYTDDGIVAEYRDNPARTFQILKKSPGNKWISLFSDGSDKMIINIPASEKVELVGR